MTNPQHIEGLTVEHVELLRSLPASRDDAESATNDADAADLCRAGFADFCSDGEHFEFWRTREGDALLATLDAFTATAVKEERQRVAGDLAKLVVTEGDPADKFVQAIFDYGIALATPQEQSGSAG